MDVMDENSRVWESLYSAGKNILVYPNESFVRMTYGLLDVQTHPRVLDYGFGAGANLLHLGRRGFKMSGIEVSKSAVAIGQKRCKQEGIDAELILSTEPTIPFGDNQFDVVVAWQVLYYNDWKSLAFAVQEIERVLRPGGIFIGTMAQEGDTSHTNSNSLGDCEYVSNVQGQEGARLLIIQESNLTRCFPGRDLRVGQFNYSFNGVESRHFIIVYQLPG